MACNTLEKVKLRRESADAESVLRSWMTTGVGQQKERQKQ